MLFDKRVSSKVEYSSGSVLLEYGLSAKKAEDVSVICAFPRNMLTPFHDARARR
jgi:hypothetical protein